MDELAEIGISTGKPTGGSSTADSVTGKLVFDEAKFLAAFDADQSSVERLMRARSARPASSSRIDGVLAPFVDVGGLLQGRMDGLDQRTHPTRVPI